MTDAALAIAVPLIARFEGFRSDPYQDSAGVWTYGFGFTVEPSGHHVTATTAPVTQTEAYARLSDMVARVLVLVRGMVHVPISDHQAAALTSLSYNVGTNALRNSTLLKHLNAREFAEAADAFMAWVYAGGAPSDGLRTRRASERAVFLTADDEPVPAPEEITENQGLRPRSA